MYKLPDFDKVQPAIRKPDQKASEWRNPAYQETFKSMATGYYQEPEPAWANTLGGCAGVFAWLLVTLSAWVITSVIILLIHNTFAPMGSYAARLVDFWEAGAAAAVFLFAVWVRVKLDVR